VFEAWTQGPASRAADGVAFLRLGASAWPRAFEDAVRAPRVGYDQYAAFKADAYKTMKHDYGDIPFVSADIREPKAQKWFSRWFSAS
jgi:hypothetical protein